MRYSLPYSRASMWEIDPKRLAEAMKRADVNQSELADKVGVKQPSIGRLLAGETKTTRALDRIAQVLRTTPAYLKGETDDAGSDAQLPAVLERPNADLMADQFDLVPVDEVSLEFGMGSTFLHDDHETLRRYVPRDWIAHFTSSPPSLLRFARGRGDSMYPTILDGDLVLIDMGETRMTRQDEIFAVGYGDLGGLKRLRSVGEGKIKVMSDNPQVSDEVSHMDEIRIIGRVCGNLRKI